MAGTEGTIWLASLASDGVVHRMRIRALLSSSRRTLVGTWKEGDREGTFVLHLTPPNP